MQVCSRPGAPDRLWAGLVLLCLALPVPGHAGDKVGSTFTVEEAVEVALRRNHDLLRSRERLREVEGRITEVRSEALPQIALQGGARRYYDESWLDLFEGFIPPKEQNWYELKTTVSQVLFSWGKVSSAVEAARLSRLQAEFEVAGTERRVKLEVHQVFDDLLLNQRLVEVARERLEQRERQLGVAKKRFDAGVVNELEVLRARVDVANAKAPLVRARNQVRQATARLNNLLARGPNAPLTPSGSLTHQPLESRDLETIVVRALDRRPEMAALRKGKEVAEKGLQIVRANDKLDVSLQAEYGFASEKIHRLNTDREVWSAGVVFRWPLFDGFRTRGQITQAASQLHSAEIAIAQLAQAIELEAKVALDDLAEAEEILKATELNIGQARKALELAETSYRYGASTSLDVTNAQFALTTALVDHARSLHDTMLTRARVLAVMDDL